MKNKYIHSAVYHNTQAAQEIVPQLISWFSPRSVVDVGCGLGTWLKVFEQQGVPDFIGLDGAHLNKDLLVVAQDKVLIKDLEKPIAIDKKFDLAISLEVGEHLHPEAADIYVQSLVKLSDVIVFSAAIPYQAGQNHLNEQWHSYWQALFAKHGYVFYDALRPLYWENTKVDCWYRQNMFVVAKKDLTMPFQATPTILRMVHPEMFVEKMQLLADGKGGVLMALKILFKSLKYLFS